MIISANIVSELLLKRSRDSYLLSLMPFYIRHIVISYSHLVNQTGNLLGLLQTTHSAHNNVSAFLSGEVM